MKKLLAIMLTLTLSITSNALCNGIDIKSIETLDLETAQKIALAESPTIEAARVRVLQAKEKVSQAWSTFWPSINVDGSATQLRLSDDDREAQLASARIFDPTANVDDPEQYYKTSITATWVLFNGFERIFTQAGAKHSQSSFRESKNEAKRLILKSVDSAFNNAQLARENIRIAEADKKYNTRLMNEAKAAYEEGAGSLSTVLNFEVLVNSAESVLIKAKRDFEIAVYGLAALMALPGSILPEGVTLAKLDIDAPVAVEAIELDFLIDYAKKHRPDAQQVEYLLKQAESGLGASWSVFYPTLALTGQYSGSRDNSPSFRQDNFGDSVALSLSYNIFAGGYNMSKVREARRVVLETRANLKNTYITIESEVREALARLEQAREQLTLQRQNTALVKKMRDLVELEYKVGQGSYVSLNEAQRNLIRAESSLVTAFVSLLSAKSGLSTTTAEILTKFK